MNLARAGLRTADIQRNVRLGVDAFSYFWFFFKPHRDMRTQSPPLPHANGFSRGGGGDHKHGTESDLFFLFCCYYFDGEGEALLLT